VLANVDRPGEAGAWVRLWRRFWDERFQNSGEKKSKKRKKRKKSKKSKKREWNRVLGEGKGSGEGERGGGGGWGKGGD